jgi:single-strand DNA-binding protein
MAGMGRAVLIGNLTKDPELRHTAGGTAVCSLSVAVNSREKQSDGEWGEYVSYFDVTVWGNQGEACAKHLHKGSPVGVDGRLKQERWKDKETGAGRSAVKIIADAVQFLPSKQGGGGSQGASEFDVPTADFNVPTDSGTSTGGGDSDDDIPFMPTL